MVNAFEVISKNKLAFRFKLTEEDAIVSNIQKNIDEGRVNFASNKYKNYDGRLLTQFDALSAENILLLHLKYQLRRTFKVKFANRNKVIDELFDKLRAVRSLNDATIIRFDLKKYFYSVSTQYIFDQYLLHSSLKREDKDYLEDVCKANSYCVAGLPIFNYFIELVSRDFDEKIRSSFRDHGMVFYSRYVDDGIIILNKYLPKKQVRKIINQAIEDIFQNTNSSNRVKINEEKFRVVNRRHLNGDNSFDFLGYEFFIKGDFKKISVGITERKRNKYQEKVNRLVKRNYDPTDPVSKELMRHIIKAHSSRVVYFAPSAKHRGVWVSKGIVASYNRLKDFNTHIEPKTTHFLKNIYKKSFRINGHVAPEYLTNKRYILYENLVRNKAMIFNPLIGMPKAVLLEELKKVGITHDPDIDYNLLVKDYLIRIKSGY